MDELESKPIKTFRPKSRKNKSNLVVPKEVRKQEFLNSLKGSGIAFGLIIFIFIIGFYSKDISSQFGWLLGPAVGLITLIFFILIIISIYKFIIWVIGK